MLRRFNLTHPPGRVFLALAILVLVAGALRITTFPRYLPYSDHWDEPSMVLLARHWRGVENIAFIPDWLTGYPPLYIWMNMGVQQAVESLTPRTWFFLGDYLYPLRLLAALSGIGTTMLVIWLGWQVGGSVAAWCAGLVWGLSPIIIEHNNFAIPDPFVYLACALSLGLAFYAQRKRPTLDKMGPPLFGSLLAGIAAVYLKYTAFYVLIPWAIIVIVMVIQGIKRPGARRAVGFWMFVYGLTIAITAGYLVFGYGALTLSNNEAARVRSTGLASMVQALLDPQRNLNNLLHAIWPIGIALFISVLALGALAYLLRWRKTNQPQPVPMLSVGLLLIYAAAGVLTTSSFFDLGGTLPASPLLITQSFVRHALPVTLALAVVWGAGAAQIVAILQSAFSTRLRQTVSASLLGCAAITAIFCITALPAIVRNLQSYRLPDSRMLLWQWADTNLPLDGDIALERGEIENTWNRYWGGYDGQKPFQWWYTDTLPALDTIQPEALRERGIAYLALTDGEVATNQAAPGAAHFWDGLTLLKHIPASSSVHGPGVYLYRTFEPEQIVEATLFGDQIALAGYDINDTALAAGETLRFRPYWRAPETPATNYSMFIHVLPVGGGEAVAQYDSNPGQANRLTLQWDDPDELIIGPWAEITLLDDLSPGAYQIAVGLYDFATGQRLLLADGADSWRLPITITADTNS